MGISSDRIGKPGNSVEKFNPGYPAYRVILDMGGGRNTRRKLVGPRSSNDDEYLFLVDAVWNGSEYVKGEIIFNCPKWELEETSHSWSFSGPVDATIRIDDLFDTTRDIFEAADCNDAIFNSYSGGVRAAAKYQVQNSVSGLFGEISIDYGSSIVLCSRTAKMTVNFLFPDQSENDVIINPKSWATIEGFV